MIDNYALAISAVAQEGMSLRYVSDTLRNNKAVVMVAVAQDASALRYVDEELRNDIEVMRIAVKQNPSSAKHSGALLCCNKVAMFEFAQVNPLMLRRASIELRDNYDFIISLAPAFKEFRLQNPTISWYGLIALSGELIGRRSSCKSSAEYASNRLCDDEDFMFKMVNIDGLALGDASDRLRDCRDLVACAMLNHVGAFWGASIRLRNDVQMRLLAGIFGDVRIMGRVHGYSAAGYMVCLRLLSW